MKKTPPETAHIAANPPYVSGGSREGGKIEENPKIQRKGAIIIGFGTFKTLIVVIWTGRGSVYNRYTEYITSYVALGRAFFFFTVFFMICLALLGPG